MDFLERPLTFLGLVPICSSAVLMAAPGAPKGSSCIVL